MVLARFLFGVHALDPAAFAGTGAVLLLVAVLAAWVPARRATRVDPVRALKAD
jgi:ABC-type antimicrobial peptide transport system permease subunit